jgi:hypothetical protein
MPRNQATTLPPANRDSRPTFVMRGLLREFPRRGQPPTLMLILHGREAPGYLLDLDPIDFVAAREHFPDTIDGLPVYSSSPQGGIIRLHGEDCLCQRCPEYSTVSTKRKKKR